MVKSWMELLDPRLESLAALMNTMLSTAPASLLSLPHEILEVLCAKLDGIALVALAKSAPRGSMLNHVARDEVTRRECSASTVLSKANAMRTVSQKVISRYYGLSQILGEPQSLDMSGLEQMNRWLGEEARRAGVPLSELVEGKVRTISVGIVGAVHRPPPASHVEGLLQQGLAVADAAATKLALLTAVDRRLQCAHGQTSPLSFSPCPTHSPLSSYYPLATPLATPQKKSRPQRSSDQAIEGLLLLSPTALP